MTTTATAPAPARQLVLTGLAHATAPLTVTELAEAVGVGRSTVSKYLPALEKAGLAVRAPGGRDGRRRLPDHWEAAPTPPAEEATSRTGENPDEAETAPPTGGATPAHEQAETVPSPIETAALVQETSPEVPVPSPEDPDTQGAAVPDPDPDARRSTASQGPNTAAPASVHAASSSTSAAPTSNADRTAFDARAGEEGVNPVSGLQRLAPGELKLMVWALLKANPQEEFTATELSHLLQGRSIGAIQNNLANLGKEGKAELACDKPRRYRFASPPA